MIDLTKLKKGMSNNPPRIVIYGPHGIGKSYFANEAGAVFVPTESGLGRIDIKGGAFPTANSLSEVYTNLTALAKQDHGFTAVCVDTVDWLEKLIFKDICQKSNAKSVALANGGYGKGYVAALEEFYNVFDALDYLREKKGMAVILLAHSKIEEYANPMGDPYDRYVLDLHVSKSVNIPNKVMEWADVVGFASYDITLYDVEGDDKKRATGHGQRVLYLEERPAFMAKSRYKTPDKIDFTWNDFIKNLK